MESYGINIKKPHKHIWRLTWAANYSFAVSEKEQTWFSWAFFSLRESGRTDRPTSCESTVRILLRHICFSRNARQTLRGSQVPSARHGDASHVSESPALRRLIHNVRPALSNGALVAFGDLTSLLTEGLQLGVLQEPQLQPSWAQIFFLGQDCFYTSAWATVAHMGKRIYKFIYLMSLLPVSSSCSRSYFRNCSPF